MGNSNSQAKLERSAPKKPESIPEREKEIEHYLSNNTDAIDRAHLYHFFKRYLFQGNFSSPVEDKLFRGKCNVLDIGCGPGTWLLDLSNKYDGSKFFGIDIKSNFPQEIKPSNLNFIKGNIFDGLPFCDEEFDFTHMETMGLMFTTEQWDFVLQEIVRVTKPGGYIEIADRLNEFKNSGPIYSKLSVALINSYLKRNVDTKTISNIDSKLKLLPNIKNVCRIEKRAIMGPQGGKMGLVFQDVALLYFSNVMATNVLSDELGISREEYKNMLKYGLVEEFKHMSPVNTHVRYFAQKVDCRFHRT